MGLRNRGGSLGHPYAVRDFLAVDPALGRSDDLRVLVDAAHAQGLRVILDWTLNRSSIDNPLAAQHPDWFQRAAAGEAIYHVPGRHAFGGFDFAQPGLRRYLIDAMLAWLTRYFGRALHAAAASVLLTLDGVAMLLMGQEFEEPHWRNWETLFEPFALGWPPSDSAILAHYRSLLGLRARHPALPGGEVVFAPGGADQVVRYWRLWKAERICVTINLAGTWRLMPSRWNCSIVTGPSGAERDALPPFGTSIQRKV